MPRACSDFPEGSEGGTASPHGFLFQLGSRLDWDWEGGIAGEGASGARREARVPVDQGFVSDGIRVVALGILGPGITPFRLSTLSTFPSPIPVPGAPSPRPHISPSTSPASARIWDIASDEIVLISRAAPWSALSAPDDSWDQPHPDPATGGRLTRLMGFLLLSPGGGSGMEGIEEFEEEGRRGSFSRTDRSGRESDARPEGDGLRDRAT